MYIYVVVVVALPDVMICVVFFATHDILVNQRKTKSWNLRLLKILI